MVHVTKVSWKELMARFTQNWYVSIVQGKNNANSTGAIFSKTLKEERVFSPGERVDHVVLATRGVTARAIGSTKGDSPAIALSTPVHLAAGNLNFFS